MLCRPKDRNKYTRLVNGFLAENNHHDTGIDHQNKHLSLMMISCEDNPPYGPSENTAKMFLDLIERAYLATKQSSHLHINLVVYEAKQKDYPSTEDEWQEYDGVIIPGSFSSAYENKDWIEILKGVIQNEIHAKGRKTMAVCFGHQIFAHSFSGKDHSSDSSTHSGGLAVPCPASLQLGRFEFTSTNTKWLSSCQKSRNEPLSILYTHGDMVKSLPTCAMSLGGTETVPIQAAVYFQDPAGLPYAYTFQGHPEYATNTGTHTFHNVLTAMSERGKISNMELTSIEERSMQALRVVEEDSIHIMKQVATMFQWF